MFEVKEIIKQEEEYGCVPACLATILQKTYKEIADHFIQDFHVEGMLLENALDYLAGYGFDIITKESKYFGSGYELARERMLQPFAEIHIVSIQRRSNSETCHSIIMSEDGKLFLPDSNDNPEFSFLEINRVVGLFYPKNYFET